MAPIPHVERRARGILLGLCVALAAPAAMAAPFDAGELRGTAILGAANSGTSRYAIVGVGIGYFVVRGLELGLDADTWLGGSPSVTRLSPGVRYVLTIPADYKPYAGVFVRQWFIGGGARDASTAGGRAGIVWPTSETSFVSVGGVYETVLTACSGDCSYYYPEIALALSFR